ncbi:hypothetical protein VJ918_04100 [Adlercreutzia sp. R21]|uniref:hypothetical protein n=1 Tax=Adlercreutzia wanghongyangiae TaxID=3111451 RepID=UPI002DB5E464|nr:hypothetical protein [Adlercreutzia sp. R21]MEC4183984.1 hypothetical protein [Adlercreutzia sp. R21]
MAGPLKRGAYSFTIASAARSRPRYQWVRPGMMRRADRQAERGIFSCPAIVFS